MIGFSSGEFAAICGVKKATLFHYDEIGLLKPSMVGANGYRYYTDKDVYAYDVIAALKEVGYSLGEIRDYLEERDPERFVELLERGRALLRDERRKIERLDRLFASSIDTTSRAGESPVGVVGFARCEEEYLIAHDAASDPAVTNKATFIKAREHIDYCREHNLAESMPIGLIIGGEDFASGSIKESWYFTRVHRKLKDKHFRIKPAGVYAILFHRGPYASLGEACGKLRRGIERAGYLQAGDVYEDDQLTFFSEREQRDYVVKLSVRVRKAKARPSP
jgi:Predicted transcriptional regulators